MKFPIITLLLIFNLSVSGYVSAQDKYNYNTIKQAKFSNLTNDQRSYLRAELTKRMSKEALMLDIYKIRAAQVELLVEASKNRTKNLKPSVSKSVRDTLSPNDKLKELGIKDPEKFMDDQKTVAIKTVKLLSLFPEINGFDSRTRKAIFRDANNLIRLNKK